MPEATITSKGQTVIPKPVRDFLGLHSGDRVDFIIQDEGSVLMKPAAQEMSRLKGLLHRPGRKPVSLATMRQAIRQGGGRA